MTIIHLGDCMDFMREQPDAAYDIIIADPPYESTPLGFDKSGSIPWPELSRELLRVLKPNGWLFVFGIGVIGRFLADWRHKFEYVWVKHAAVMATESTVRPYYKHESINAFIKPNLKRVSDLYFDREAIATESIRVRRSSGRIFPTDFSKSHHYTKNHHSLDTFMRHANTILQFPTKTHFPIAERTDHPTQKPVFLYETLLLGYCPPGGLAFDPFGGSGTIAIAAMNTGRQYHLTEINPEYHAIIKARVARHVPRMETARRQRTITAYGGGGTERHA